MFNPGGSFKEGLEERVQKAHKAWWKDAQIYRSKNVLGSVKCSRVVEHVCSVFIFGCARWSWSQWTMHDKKGMGDKHDESAFQASTSTRLFDVPRQQIVASMLGEQVNTWVDGCSFAT